MKRRDFLKLIGSVSAVVVLTPSVLAQASEFNEMSKWHFYHKGIRYNVFVEYMGNDKIYDLKTVIVIGDGMVWQRKFSSEALRDKAFSREMTETESIEAFERLQSSSYFKQLNLHSNGKLHILGCRFFHRFWVSLAPGVRSGAFLFE